MSHSPFRRFLLQIPFAGGVLLITAASVALSLLTIWLVILLGVDFGTQSDVVLLVGVAVPLAVAAPSSGLVLQLLYEVKEARDYALKLAWRDELTCLYNRRRFLEIGSREFDLARRSGQTLIGVVMDLDNFKLVNDIHGHAAGDEVLRVAARVITETLRSTDILCRWGGEEFAFLLPGTTAKVGEVALKRLLWALQCSEIDVGFSTPLKITASVGFATIDETCLNLKVLIDRADLAMYEAKRAGKNRVLPHLA